MKKNKIIANLQAVALDILGIDDDTAFEDREMLEKMSVLESELSALLESSEDGKSKLGELCDIHTNINADEVDTMFYVGYQTGFLLALAGLGAALPEGTLRELLPVIPDLKLEF